MKTIILLITVMCFIGFNSVKGQSGSINTDWSVVEGLYGGNVNDIAIHPTDENIVWVSTVNGIYKTINGGENWTLKSNGLPYGEIFDVEIDKNNPDILFVMTSWSETEGIYKTTDGGENWILVKLNFVNSGRFNLAINPSNSNIIYAIKDGLNMSEDGGTNWNKIKNSANKIFIDPNNPNTILIIDNWSEIFKSTDGINWQNITNNLSSFTTSPNQIVIDPTNSDIMYVPSNEGVYKTINGGAVWFQTGLSNTTAPICIDKNSTNILYAPAEFGVYKTMDGGINWTKIRDVGRAWIIEISDNSSSLFAGIENGTLEKSIDAGITWEKKQTGIISYNTNNLHFSSANENAIFVGTQQAGMFSSLDNGETWENSSVWDNGVWYASPPYSNSVITDPTDENVIYVCFNNSSILKSINGGATWNWIMHDDQSVSANSSLVIDYSNTNTIYVSNDQGGIYKTINGGDLWEQKNSGLLVLDVRLLIIHPSNSNIIYSATRGGGVFKTIDAGENWASISNGLTNWNVSSIVINQNNPNIIYAGTIDGTGSFFKTIDGGENWILSNTGLPANANVQDIEIDPIDSDILYLSTQGNGIYISTNLGETWKPASLNLPDQNILCLGKRAEGLYAGSSSKGLLLSDIFLIKNPETTNITCVGNNDGSITVNIFGGLAPYQYSIDNGTTFQVSNEFAGLIPGEYQITVKDAIETIVNWDETIILTEPDTVNLGADFTTCEGETVELDAGIFEIYFWDDESTEQTLEVTASGTYSVTVTDANSCVSNDEIIAAFNSLPTATITSENATICEGETTDISIELTGTAPWNITYTNGTTPATETTSENPYVFTVSTAGTYEVIAVSDANCTGIDFGNSTTVTVNPVYNETDVAGICSGDTYSFGTQTLSVAGDYTEVFTSVAGCDSTVILTLTVNPLPTATIT
ncbi:MAG: hypothetical protein PF489_03760, partial [Salinivirgaceae bacterium]|nr:hypothetical protein [Salinivirgaceae bacterium]